MQNLAALYYSFMTKKTRSRAVAQLSASGRAARFPNRRGKTVGNQGADIGTGQRF